MKVLIIGSEGFIGSHLVRYFQEEGHDVHGCDISGTPAPSYHYIRFDRGVTDWYALFTSHRYDCCINAAGNGNVPFSVTHPLSDFRSNVQDTAELLDAIRQSGAYCRYLHISSAAVYGNQLELPVSESASCNPVSPYGWHKWMAEQLCREYSSLYGLSIAIVRPFSIYGPGLRKQLFWDIYQKYLNNDAMVEMWGTGSESRDFIHIDDVVRAFALLINKAPMIAECYNLASGQETTISHAVSLFLQQMPDKKKVVFNGKVREGDPLNWQADIQRIRELGFQPSVQFEEGIQQLALWLISTHQSR